MIDSQPENSELRLTLLYRASPNSDRRSRRSWSVHTRRIWLAMSFGLFGSHDTAASATCSGMSRSVEAMTGQRLANASQIGRLKDSPKDGTTSATAPRYSVIFSDSLTK